MGQTGHNQTGLKKYQIIVDPSKSPPQSKIPRITKEKHAGNELFFTQGVKLTP